MIVEIIIYLICHLTLHEHLIDESCKFKGGSSLEYVTTLLSLMTKSIVTLEI